MVKMIIIRRHAVGGGHRPERTDIIIGPAIAHNPDGAHRQQNGKGLPDHVIETGILDFLKIDIIGLTQDIAFFRRDIPRNADRQTRPWKRMPPNESFRQAKLPAQFPHFILE